MKQIQDTSKCRFMRSYWNSWFIMEFNYHRLTVEVMYQGMNAFLMVMAWVWWATDLEKTWWHGSTWHAVTRGHPSHHRTGSCCCTLKIKQQTEHYKLLLKLNLCFCLISARLWKMYYWMSPVESTNVHSLNLHHSWFFSIKGGFNVVVTEASEPSWSRI